jgi:hypothetical protein
VGVRPEACGDIVRHGDVGIAENLDLAWVVMLENGPQKVCDRVLAEVGRDVADAQAPLRVAIVGVGLGRDGGSVLLVPAKVFLKQGVRVGSRVIVATSQEVAVGGTYVWAAAHGLLEGVHGLIEPTLVHQGNAQISVSFVGIVVEPDRLAVLGDSLIQLTIVVQSEAQAGVQPRVMGLQPHGLPALGDRFLALARRLECQA